MVEKKSENPIEPEESVEPVEVCILTPAHAPEARLACENSARPEWTFTPWIFYSGDVDVLDELISEDKELYPTEVMDAARPIAYKLYEAVAASGLQKLTSYRFYPQVSAQELESICRDRGWKVHPFEPLSEEPEAELPFDETGVQGVAFDELSDERKAMVETFVSTLSPQRWRDVDKWYQVLKSGLNVSPVAFGRYFGTRGTLEIALWFHDEALTRALGARQDAVFLRLVIRSADQENSIILRLYFGDQLEAVLKTVVEFQKEINLETFQETFLPRLSALCDQVVLEEKNGQLVKIDLS